MGARTIEAAEESFAAGKEGEPRRAVAEGDRGGCHRAAVSIQYATQALPGRQAAALDFEPRGDGLDRVCC